MAQELAIIIKAKDEASGVLKQLEGSTKQAGGGFANLGKIVAGTAAGFGLASIATQGLKSAISSSIGAAIGFDTAMQNVNSIARLSDDSLKELKGSVLDMVKSGDSAGQSAGTLAAALYDVYSSGFKGEQALNVVNVAAKGAAAGLTSTEVSTKALAAILNAFPPGAYSAESAMDIMFKTVDQGVITFEELASTMGLAIPAAAALGVPLEEIGAAIAVLTRNGLDASMSMTSIQSILSNLLKPSKEAADLAEELGLDWDAAAVQGKGMVATLQDMIVKTGGSQEKMAVLLGDVRAIRGALVLAKGEGQDFSDMLGVMQTASEGAGATAVALTEQSKGLDFQWNVLKARAQALAIEGLTPLIGKMAGLTEQINSEVIPSLSAWKKEHEEDLAAMQNATEVFFAALIPLAVASLKLFTAPFLFTFEAISGALKVFKGVFHGDWQLVLDGLNQMAQAPLKALEWAFSGTWDAVNALTSGKLEELKTTVSSKLGAIGAAVGEQISVVQNLLLGLPGTLYNLGKNAIQGLIDGMKDMLGDVIGVAGDIAGGVIGGFKKTFGIGSPSKVMAEMGADVTLGLVEGIRSQEDQLRATIMALKTRLEGISDPVFRQQIVDQWKATLDELAALVMGAAGAIPAPLLTPSAGGGSSVPQFPSGPGVGPAPGPSPLVKDVFSGELRLTVARALGVAIFDMNRWAVERLIGILNAAGRSIVPTIRQLANFEGYHPDLFLSQLRAEGFAFHRGGVVPGPVGREVPVMALGGERFLPPGQGAGNVIVFERGAIAISAIDGASVERITPELTRHIDRHLRRLGKAGIV